MIRAGKMNKLISILSPISTSSNDFAEPIYTDSTFAGNIWARVEPLSGREYFLANQTVSDISVRFSIYYLSGLTDKMKVLHNGEKYDIKSIINFEERDEELQLMCAKVAT